MNWKSSRYVLLVEGTLRPLSVWIAVDREIKPTSDSEWLETRSYVSVAFNPFDWLFGFGMYFYEQEFWRLSFGPFHINWTS